MAANCPKQYLSIGGRSILQIGVSAFLQHAALTHVYVVVSPDDAYVADALQADARLTVLFCGGATRAESVMNGLRAMHADVTGNDWVMVHDAARPGLHEALITRLIDQVGDDEVGGLLALPVADTLKQQSPDHSSLVTVPRAGMWLAQTPQMFRHGPLLAALERVGAEVTDDASAMEACGLTPLLVEGHWCNTKITRPDDLPLVASFLTALP